VRSDHTCPAAAAAGSPGYARLPVGPTAHDRTPAEETRSWLAALQGPPAMREDACARLHALLLRGARFEVARRRGLLAHVPHGELDDLATQAADDALIAVLGKLDSFRGQSRFTTWAYKFVLLEAGVRLRRRAWQGREVPLDEEGRAPVRDTRPSAHEVLETAELLEAVRAAIGTALSPHQREVFSALALNGVPIDVLAERLGTTRGALYKTLHDARRKLRSELAAGGLGDDRWRTP
jgi:RNA polymerase sigma-70 factor, ECF subfamily